MRKNFSFIYPVTKKPEGRVRKWGQPYEHIADLLIKGVAHFTKAGVLNNISNKYKIDISGIWYEGRNLFPHTDTFDSLENIKAACLNHVEELFNNTQVLDDDREQPPKMYPALAKVITLPLRRKVN